jgi:Heterokaryon incompatibility protein (HET)
MASKYVYQRHLPADYVRLLTLVSDGKNFRGSLEEFRRDNLPYFNALSWCWGSRGEGQTTVFTCDGQPFPVSQHLYELLSSLNPKSAHSSVRIWIDSICINQDHVEEKNIHVAHMHEIYGQAGNVIVWLGTPEDGSDLVMDSKKISELNKTLQLLPGSKIALSVTAPELPHAEDPIWKAIGRLCDRDWFYRTWVIQEIALARKAELLCGTQWLDWGDFVNLVCSVGRAGLTSICRGPRSTGMTRPDGFGVLMDLSSTQTMVQNNDLSMNYLLHMVRLKEVTKPVDKVYGLLGIISEDMRSAIKVNYAENDRQYWKAYVELAEQIVTADDPGFWLLCMASSRERPEQLPTWCPNFNSLTPEYLDFGNQKWRAGLGDKAAEDGSIRLIKDSSSIQIPGFQIDVVDEVFYIGGPYSAAVRQEDGGRGGNMAAFLERDRKCLELTLHLFDDVNNAQDAYARTLIVDSWINGLLIQLSQTERVRNAYEDSKAYLAQSDTSTTAATHISADDERQQLAQQYITQLGWWQERPFYTTKNGRIGRGAFNMQAGDAICVFYRARPVFILRYEQGSEVWKLVGDAYLHGCMDLESMPEAGRGPDVKFTIS